MRDKTCFIRDKTYHRRKSSPVSTGMRVISVEMLFKSGETKEKKWKNEKKLSRDSFYL
jgi:hypothetical protein